MGQHEDVARRERHVRAGLGRHGQRAGAPGAGEVEDETRVRARGEEAFRVRRAAAEERDRRRLEGVGRQGRDEGRLVVVAGQDPPALSRLVEEVEGRRGEAPFLQHGAHVPAEQGRRFDERDRNARGLCHAASAGWLRNSPARRARGADAAYVTSRPARAYWRSHQMRARIAAKRRK